MRPATLIPPNTAWGDVEASPHAVFVETDKLALFVKRVLPCVREDARFALLIGDSDLTSPRQIDVRGRSPILPMGKWDRLLADARIVRVFVEHLDVPPSTNSKLTPIPIGFNPRVIAGFDLDSQLRVLEKERAKESDVKNAVKNRPLLALQCGNTKE